MRAETGAEGGLHVVQVSGYLDPNGREPEELLEAWPTLVEVAAAAARTGVRVTVLQACRRDATLRRGGVLFRFVDRGEMGLIGRLPRRLARLAGRLEPDVVHLQGMGFPLLARLLTGGSGAPVLVQDHGDRVPPLYRRPYHRWGLARIRAVAFTASEQARPWVTAGVLSSSVPVLEVLESSTRFGPGDHEAARRATGLRGDPAVLWVGRLNANKDPLTAMEAVAQASKALPGLQLWCCFREAPLLDRVRARVRDDPRLQGRVHLVGPVPHGGVEMLSRAADLFLSASHREGSGYALLEALACGLTPVVTDIPSFRRITRQSVGTLVPPGDAPAFARALEHHAGQDRGRARRRMVEHFRRHLSFDAVGRELRSAYETVASARHRTALGREA